MPINFHDEKNKGTYTTRTADDTWMRFIEKRMDVRNKRVADIGSSYCRKRLMDRLDSQKK
ncbi:hypothetical protein HZF08_04815 [Paenibacillus sp. CGMCC 1.16610]|uniref:Uncharacterized protein n=1 Tax=Paenibacillus anseongense TaxID=2682845 RepID=A0ABW9UD53_9BACL|nr:MULTISPECIES: hypothetical protein [Paenibacillus]MBA2937615.1 hypothetical protein [Paenibacillus sp. CGMCC 1.16610]MVQ36673.1 hypothetical protein [Paenibacillus anseongense]